MMLAAPSRVLQFVLVAACALGAAAQAPRTAGKPRPATNATSADATPVPETEGKRWGSFWQYYEETERVCVGAELDASTGRGPCRSPSLSLSSSLALSNSRVFTKPPVTSSTPRPSAPPPSVSTPSMCRSRRPPCSLPSPHPLPAPQHARTVPHHPRHLPSSALPAPWLTRVSGKALLTTCFLNSLNSILSIDSVCSSVPRT
jgi:hypothetical protein